MLTGILSDLGYIPTGVELTNRLNFPLISSIKTTLALAVEQHLFIQPNHKLPLNHLFLLQ